MTCSLNDNAGNGEAPARRTPVDSRAHGLLGVWGRSDAPHTHGAPDTHELEQHLLAAYHAANNLSPDDVDASERQTLRAMADECASEMKSARAEFSAMVEQHERYLRRIASRLAGDPETAKDLVQETLSRALRCFDRFEHGTNARAWLVKILTRLYLDMLKHRRVISRAEHDLATLASVEHEPPWLRIADAELWAAVQELEPDLRGVVERCYLRNMSYRAIADELKVPVGTIGTRLMRARERLRVLLAVSDRPRT